MEAKTEFIVEGKKKFFHMLPYVLEVTGNGKTFSKDCWEIRITPLGAKAVLEHLINDKLLNLKDYNQIMILSSKFFESIDPEDVQKVG